MGSGATMQPHKLSASELFKVTFQKKPGHSDGSQNGFKDFRFREYIEFSKAISIDQNIMALSQNYNNKAY